MVFLDASAPVVSREPVLRRPFRAPLLAAGAAALVAAALVAVARWIGIAPRRLFQDPAGQFDFPAYAGLISYLGVALLVATTTIGLFAVALRGRGAAPLGLVAGFSALLAADALLMLHERVLPAVLGLHEVALYGLYAALVALILVRLPRGLGSWGVVVPLGLLAASVGVDLMEMPMNTRVLLEDTAKVAGFAAWLAFWASFAAARMREGMAGGARA